MRWGLWIRKWRLQGATRSGRKDRNQTKRLLARKSSNCRGSWDEYIGSGDLLRVAGVEGCDERLGLSSNSVVARLRRSLGGYVSYQKRSQSIGRGGDGSWAGACTAREEPGTTGFIKNEWLRRQGDDTVLCTPK